MCDDREGGDDVEGATEEEASEARLGLCEHALQLAWKTVRDLGNDPQAFWPALGAFVRAAFAPRLLALRVDDPVAGRLAGALAQVSGTAATRAPGSRRRLSRSLLFEGRKMSFSSFVTRHVY